jgi:hypothetical protein
LFGLLGHAYARRRHAGRKRLSVGMPSFAGNHDIPTLSPIIYDPRAVGQMISSHQYNLWPLKLEACIFGLVYS